MGREGGGGLGEPHWPQRCAGHCWSPHLRVSGLPVARYFSATSVPYGIQLEGAKLTACGGRTEGRCDGHPEALPTRPGVATVSQPGFAHHSTTFFRKGQECGLFRTACPAGPALQDGGLKRRRPPGHTTACALTSATLKPQLKPEWYASGMVTMKLPGSCTTRYTGTPRFCGIGGDTQRLGPVWCATMYGGGPRHVTCILLC